MTNQSVESTTGSKKDLHTQARRELNRRLITVKENLADQTARAKAAAKEAGRQAKKDIRRAKKDARRAQKDAVKTARLTARGKVGATRAKAGSAASAVEHRVTPKARTKTAPKKKVAAKK